tara:strand:+ start:17400 stop:18359 length:960 start_codon:yes stop_codon:yes gene_type:complete
MPLKVAIQMDPVEKITFDVDNTYVLGLEAQKRGHSLYYYTPDQLRLEDGRVSAAAYPITFHLDENKRYTLGEKTIIDLHDDIDLVLMRQDPPFDMRYITATHMLDHLKGDTLVLNDPTEVRNAPEKIWATHFPDLVPATLITADKNALLDFYKKYGNIVLKPLYSKGGEQIYHVDTNSFNLSTLLEMFEMFYKEPIIAQKYIPEARQGDKRVILIDGEPAGATLRVPAAGEARANTNVGSTHVKTTLTERDLEICARLKPYLQERNLVFTGIDIIGDYLTEINVTSPGGFIFVNAIDGTHLEVNLWDAFEKKVNEAKSK